MKKILLIIGIILLAGLVYSQVAGVPNFPSTFTYVLPNLPLPQSSTQLLWGTCPYILPIELKDVKVYSVGGNALSPEIEAQIRIYTNNKRSICSRSITLPVAPSVSSSALAANFVNALDQNLIAEANLNTQPFSPPNPIASTP